MSPLGIILVVVLIIFLAGGFSGRFGGTVTVSVMVASVFPPSS